MQMTNSDQTYDGYITLYARSSTQHVESDSTESQLEELRRWAVEKNYMVCGEFKDLCSGRKLECRLGLQEAIVYAKATNSKIAIVEASRLSRSVKHTADLMDSETQFVFTRSGVSMSKEMILMKSIFNQMESEAISRRVKAGINNLFETTEGARQAWGEARHRASTIQSMNTAWVSKADTFAVKTGKYAEMLREKGETYQTIANIYNSTGIKTSRGGKSLWSATTIRTLINRYRGLMTEQE